MTHAAVAEPRPAPTPTTETWRLRMTPRQRQALLVATGGDPPSDLGGGTLIMEVDRQAGRATVLTGILRNFFGPGFGMNNPIQPGTQTAELRLRIAENGHLTVTLDRDSLAVVLHNLLGAEVEDGPDFQIQGRLTIE